MADVRLIDANALAQRFSALQEGASLRDHMYLLGVLSTIDNAPTIDAVPVVRCKDCKYHRNAGCPMRTLHVAPYGYKVNDSTTDNGFCHMGAKMDVKEE